MVSDRCPRCSEPEGDEADAVTHSDGPVRVIIMGGPRSGGPVMSPLTSVCARACVPLRGVVLPGPSSPSTQTTRGAAAAKTTAKAPAKKAAGKQPAKAAAKVTDEIRASEMKLADEFRKLGKTVIGPDRAAFRAAAIPLHNDASAGAGWSKAEYDALQALK